MTKLLIYCIIFWQFFSFSVFAQDDTEEGITGTFTFANDEIDEEKRYLDFKSSFIDALLQKNIENYDRALESLGKCESIYPENVAMLFEKAKNHFALKQYVEAHHYCDKALGLESNNFWIMALSRDIYEKEFNYPEAIAIQKKLFEMKNSEAGNLLMLYYRAKNKKEGQKLISKIEKNYIYVLNIDFYTNHFNKKNTVITSKKTQKENLISNNINDLKEVFSKDKNFRILEKILVKEFQDKQFEALLADCDTGLTLFPAQAKVYLYKGIALNGLGKYKEAAIVLESGLDFIFDNTQLIKQFYSALIVSYSGTKNTSKVNHYKQMVQKL